MNVGVQEYFEPEQVAGGLLIYCDKIRKWAMVGVSE